MKVNYNKLKNIMDVEIEYENINKNLNIMEKNKNF